MKKFNDWVAIKITDIVGSMWCAYVFMCLALISLPAAIESHSVIVIISWITQTCLQLVLLSVILNGQNIQGERQERMIQHIEHLVELIEQDEEKEIDELKLK
jgi:hypothetical protein